MFITLFAALSIAPLFYPSLRLLIPVITLASILIQMLVISISGFYICMPFIAVSSMLCSMLLGRIYHRVGDNVIGMASLAHLGVTIMAVTAMIEYNPSHPFDIGFYEYWAVFATAINLTLLLLSLTNIWRLRHERLHCVLFFSNRGRCFGSRGCAHGRDDNKTTHREAK